ncbi:hypothetical protein ABTZ99_08790 [Actinosynnema sp. NPDC002837]
MSTRRNDQPPPTPDSSEPPDPRRRSAPATTFPVATVFATPGLLTASPLPGKPPRPPGADAGTEVAFPSEKD